MSISFNYKGDGSINFPVGSGALKLIPDSVAQSPQNQNLIYLFDPVYYNGYRNTSESSFDAYLNKIFQKYPSIIPVSNYVFSRGRIFNKPNDPDNLIRKANFNNFFFSYDKYTNNSDTFISNKSNFNRKANWSANGIIERKKTLLQLNDPSANTFRILQENTSKTFSCFVKLKAPVQHKSAATSHQYKIIREKKGIFLNTKEFSIGYRSPYYTRTGNVNAYKYKFEPFSFVFGIICQGRHHTFMTDFKYKFNETYNLAITVECGSINPSNHYLGTLKVKVYVNGEQQTCAYLPFNPLIGGNGNSSSNPKYTQSIKEKKLASPIQPNFYKFDGTIYSPTANEFNLYTKLAGPHTGDSTYILIGRSNFPSGRPYGDGGPLSVACKKMVKRYLNNIDVGVIQIYNTALSQIDIKKISDTFGPRYQ
jgi:hypothetical protein